MGRLVARLICGFWLIAAGPVLAQDLKLGVSSPATSADPHFHNLIPNFGLAQHIYDSLIEMDADSKIVPALALSMKPTGDTTWEVKLRPDVKFHDGSTLSAEDVVWSLKRPPTIANSPGPLTIYTRSIASAEAVDPLTLKITTSSPYPLLPNDLSQIYILSRKASEGVKSEDFGPGKGAIGTGPYKLVGFTRDDRAELERFDGGWRKAAWAHVSYRWITNDNSRLAALLAGDIDAIDTVPTASMTQIKGDSRFVFAQKPSLRIIYFYLDSGRDQTPLVTVKDGPAGNPLRNPKVRRAISMAINREAIRDRIMEGASFATSQFVPPSLIEGDSGFELIKYDPEGAKKLLAEAGYPNGFAMTADSPNNRFPNDSRITEAVAQMLTRIGIQTQVETMPMATYATRGQKGDFSFGLIGWGAQTGEISSTLRAIIACESKEKGLGQFNWSHYCNPAVDDLLLKGLATMDDKARAQTLRDAAKLAANDGAIVPIHFQASNWAAKKGIAVEARTDERTYAMSFKPAQGN